MRTIKGKLGYSFKDGLMYERSDEPTFWIAMWPCGTWCDREDIEEMNHMSDDYSLEEVTETEYGIMSAGA